MLVNQCLKNELQDSAKPRVARLNFRLAKKRITFDVIYEKVALLANQCLCSRGASRCR